MHLTPAYGRDYTSRAKVLEDFKSDKDFTLTLFGGRSTYANRTSLKDEPDSTHIQFRYAKLRKTFSVKLGDVR